MCEFCEFLPRRKSSFFVFCEDFGMKVRTEPSTSPFEMSRPDCDLRRIVGKVDKKSRSTEDTASRPFYSRVPSSAAASALLATKRPSRLSTYGSHGTTAAALLVLFCFRHPQTLPNVRNMRICASVSTRKLGVACVLSQNQQCTGGE